MNSDTEYELLMEATTIANSEFDGHLTIGKFTTGWQVFGNTPGDIQDWHVFPLSTTLAGALESFIQNRRDIDNRPTADVQG